MQLFGLVCRTESSCLTTVPLNDAVKSVTTAVSLSVTDTTVAVLPSGNNSLSPSINSEVNLDATPVMVSFALSPSIPPMHYLLV